ncbi:MAG TPA: phosphoribosyltransferase family protein [Pyrinomonadaceae bacterium]
MTDFQTFSLHQINKLPFATDEEIFHQYPGFKLGVMRCIRHYARQLLPLLKQILSLSSKHEGWILTSPAMTAQTPAAANLLCWELFDLYSEEQGTAAFKELTLVDMQHEKDSNWTNWKDPNKPQDYAKLEFADRVTEHEKLSQRLTQNPVFQDRPILFINDIRITGAQEQSMRQHFTDLGAKNVSWLYLIVVDPEIGKADPTIEWRINFVPFAELLHLVTQEEIHFTAKCVQRLMSLDQSELEQILSELPNEQRDRLLEIATRNEFGNMPNFVKQFELLKTYQSSLTNVSTTSQ